MRKSRSKKVYERLNLASRLRNNVSGGLKTGKPNKVDLMSDLGMELVRSTIADAHRGKKECIV